MGTIKWFPQIGRKIPMSGGAVNFFTSLSIIL